FLQTVVHVFISKTQKILDAMRTALANREYGALKELAHMVKGSSGNVGAEALHEVCREILLCEQDKLELSGDELLRRANASFKSARILLLQYLGGANRISI
ncbi:MAG TPA: Hpt domain-containing protein, partial [Methylophilaceae bacterium]|nr:Hpt domain-containing protein [Methylophilaceae bacterium]